MMKNKCAVPSCSNRKHHIYKEHTFHRFPSENQELCAAWSHAIGSPALVQFFKAGARPAYLKYVCSAHFLESDFKAFPKRRVLKSTAVPSVFATSSSQTCQFSPNVTMSSLSPASTVGTEPPGRGKRPRQLPRHFQDFELGRSVESSLEPEKGSPAPGSSVSIEPKHEAEVQVKIEDLDFMPRSTVSFEPEPKAEIEVEIEDLDFTTGSTVYEPKAEVEVKIEDLDFGESEDSTSLQKKSSPEPASNSAKAEIVVEVEDTADTAYAMFDDDSSTPVVKKRRTPQKQPQKFIPKYKRDGPSPRPPHLKGASGCRRHLVVRKHQKLLATTDPAPRVNSRYLTEHDLAVIRAENLTEHDLAAIRAETLFTSYLVKHNLPLAAAYHAGPLFRGMFPDSEIAKRFGHARKNASCIVKRLIGVDDIYTTEAMRRSPYSLAIDTSADTEDGAQTYPVVVRIFDTSHGRVVTRLLNICESRGSTGEALFKLVSGELARRGVPWYNCVSFADVAQIPCQGISAFLKARWSNIHLVSCASHMIHLAAERASRQLSVDVEDFLVNVYYYLAKSGRKRAHPRGLQVMCEASVRKTLEMAVTRWLCLGQYLSRLLSQWDPLTAFFESEVTLEIRTKAPSSCTQDGNPQEIHRENLTKPQKLLRFLTDPMSKLYALFLDRATAIFDISKHIVEKEEPCIHVLRTTLELQLHRILTSFCKPEHVVAMMHKVGIGIQPTEYSRVSFQLPNKALYIGEATQEFIQSHRRLELEPFFRDVRKYFSSAAECIVSRFPFHDELLMHATVADISKRQHVTFHSLEYFIRRFPSILPRVDAVDQVEEEFRLYQTTSLEACNILKKRADEAWRDVGLLKRGGKEIFSNLSKAMLGILVILHSNAGCEGIFRLVAKKKKLYRGNMSVDMWTALVAEEVNSFAAKGSVGHMVK